MVCWSAAQTQNEVCVCGSFHCRPSRCSEPPLGSHHAVGPVATSAQMPLVVVSVSSPVLLNMTNALLSPDCEVANFECVVSKVIFVYVWESDVCERKEGWFTCCWFSCVVLLF